MLGSGWTVGSAQFRCQSRGDLSSCESRQALGGRDWELELTIMEEARLFTYGKEGAVELARHGRV